jgi:hypothetical protein
MGAGGTGGAAPAASGAMGNPYKTRDIVKMAQLEMDNPELAAKLKAEAAK